MVAKLISRYKEVTRKTQEHLTTPSSAKLVKRIIITKKLDLVNLAKKKIRSHEYLTPYLAIDNIWARYILSMTWLMSCVRSHSTINKLVCRPVSIDLAHHDQKFNHIQSSVNIYHVSLFIPTQNYSPLEQSMYPKSIYH